MQSVNDNAIVNVVMVRTLCKVAFRIDRVTSDDGMNNILSRSNREQ